MSSDRKLWTKKAAEVKALVYDVGDGLDLEAGEKIDNPTAAAPTVSPAGLLVTAVQKNGAELRRPGKRSIAPGEGLQAFLTGGTAGTVYLVTFTFTTIGGGSQTLEATLRVKVI